jgi:hypothetical protein
VISEHGVNSQRSLQVLQVSGRHFRGDSLRIISAAVNVVTKQDDQIRMLRVCEIDDTLQLRFVDVAIIGVQVANHRDADAAEFLRP